MNTKVSTKTKEFKGIKHHPSLLGFGCMRFPVLEEGKPDIDKKKAQDMIDYAYQHGVNYFDTAYPYHDGLSESFIGEALKKYPRQSFFLASKMPGWEIETAEDAKRIFYEQLKKCQVDYFDYYLAHALSKENVKVYTKPGVMDFLYEMKKQGKIKHLGFSFHDTPEVLKEIVELFDWDFVQLQINYLDWTFQDAKTQYAIAKAHDLPVIVMEPVRGGTLANLSEAAGRVLKSANKEASIASWAMRYAASLEQVIVVLSGMSNKAQTKDNIQSLTHFKPLTANEQDTLDKALDVFLENGIILCTKCNYCMPCPEDVNIPKVIDCYNQGVIDDNTEAFVKRYEMIEKHQRADHCIACGICLTHCPQKLEIPTHMKTIDDFYEKNRS